MAIGCFDAIYSKHDRILCTVVKVLAVRDRAVFIERVCNVLYFTKVNLPSATRSVISFPASVETHAPS